MITFQPTDTELLDYRLGRTDPSLTRQIEAYLNTHSETERQLAEHNEIEQLFKNYPLIEPGQSVLERVRHQAARQVRPKFWTTFFDRFALPIPRALAWTATIVLVVGLGYFVMQSNTLTPTSPPYQNAPATLTGNTAPPPSTVVNESKVATDGPATESLAEADYAQALAFFNDNRFAEACQLFQKIDNTYPD